MTKNVTTMVAVALMAFGSAEAAAAPQGETARLQEALYRTQAGLAYTQDRMRAVNQEAYARALRARLRVGAVRSRTPSLPEPWLQQDPADSLYRAARAALNRRQYDRSAELFEQIRDRYPRSGYAADSYYFQALALQQGGGTRSLERALGLLESMLESQETAATQAEARELQLRIQGLLARQGNARAARAVTQQAQARCDESNQSLRAAALNALLQMDSEQALPILNEVLEDRDVCSAELRRQAIFILAQHMDDGAVDVLLDLAYRNPDPDPEVREQAVFWLSQVDSEEALVALESILGDADADPQLQERAVFAVAQHSSPRAVEILRGYAERSGSPMNLRENAIFWLGQRSEDGGSEYLRGLYGRLQDPALKERALFAVAQSGTQADGEWIMARARDANEDPELRKTALFWAGQMGVVRVADLRAMYGSLQDDEMKEQVVFVLAQSEGSEAVDALMEIAENEDNAELKERAIFWLGQTDDPRVPEFLLRIIRGGGS